jgi:hypothetical protein
MLRYLYSCATLALLAACSTLPNPSTVSSSTQSLKGSLEANSGTDFYSLAFVWSTNITLDDNSLRCRFDAQSDGHWEYDGICPSTLGKKWGLEYTYAQFGRYTATFETFSPTEVSRVSLPVRVPLNRSPQIDALDAVISATGRAQVLMRFSDPDGDRLNCQLQLDGQLIASGNRCGQTLHQYQFERAGNYQLSLTVSDGSTVTRQQRQLEVRLPDQPTRQEVTLGLHRP